MIRITITKKYPRLGLGIFEERKIIVKEFKDEGSAQNWFIYDSYFAEPYVESALWERIE